MTLRHRSGFSIKKFFFAAALAFVIVVSAPFVGLLRDYLFDTFAGRAVLVLSVAFALLGLGLLVYAVAKIRQRRGLRYAGLAASVALVGLQAVGFRTELAQVNVAEKMHLVEYGLLAILLYWGQLSSKRRLSSPQPASTQSEISTSQTPTSDLSLFLMPLLAVVFVGTLDEAMQWLVETRTGEFRDVLLNLLSGACGLLFAFSLKPPERFAWRLAGARRLRLAGALTTLLVGGFYYLAHLGYVIEDPEIGRFRSWYSPQGLLEASAERQERWESRPPGDLSPWTREDFYLTEAGWHNRHRNASLEAGDDALALQANRILEKYYAPYLDLESFRQTGDRRFPPHAKARVERSAPQIDTATYISPVLAGRITIWPSKPVFLLGLALTVALWSLVSVAKH